MPGQALPAAGPYRFGRPLEACEPALESEKAPEHRVSLGWNERNFLSLQACLGSVGVADALKADMAVCALGALHLPSLGPQALCKGAPGGT